MTRPRACPSCRSNYLAVRLCPKLVGGTLHAHEPFIEGECRSCDSDWHDYEDPAAKAARTMQDEETGWTYSGLSAQERWEYQ